MQFRQVSANAAKRENVVGQRRVALLRAASSLSNQKYRRTQIPPSPRAKISRHRTSSTARGRI